MTKAEMVREIADKTGIEKQVVMQIVEGMMESIRNSMINGEEVFLRGFGSFIIKRRAQKTARNISKNTTIVIPAHNIPAFKPSKSFRLKVK
ncbi:HU family DNA-binding protein [uncultured Alistipes sp.]|jgi:DNA-binding protein HU-beta|uniref:HU family DNA-binding protein n=1 Tax=uncultured Alistipes sp. TaxID=538949 RepID=UPI002053E443|nr:HU family DNA-binding protein [uncultured Alistipes sp.]DAZ54471.1 MAG TPA: DNA binding protein [Caudoviricetes sp.]